MEQSKKNTYIIAAIVFIFLIVGIYFLFFFHKTPKRIAKEESTASEVKQITDLELSKRPYVTLTPTADGAEIIISIENMAAFDRLEYELTYEADNPTTPGTKVLRGSTGADINAKEPKYKTSILLGTASRGVRSPDTGITDGKLTLHMFKGDTEYLSETPWDLFQIGQTASTVTDKSANFSLEVPTLGKYYWLILADTVGIPQGGTFDLKNVALPAYGLFSVAPTFQSPSTLTLKTDAQSPSLFAYSTQESTWTKLDSKYLESSKTLTADIENFATFVVVSAK